MIKDLQKFLKGYGVILDKQMISMVLGGIIVILVGIFAYSYFRSRTPQESTPSPEETNEATTGGELTGPTTSVALPTIYTVVSGDTLWSIAEKFYSSGYNFVDIASANNLVSAGSIDIGQKLTIPKVEVRQPLTTSATITPTVSASQISGTSYTVIKGDCLWTIAVRAYGDGYRWVDLAKANSLVNPGLIHSGNVLTIPR